MATSNTRAFDPTLAEIIVEAFERCGIRPQLITSEHVEASLRSMNLLLAEWHSSGWKQFELAKRTLPVVAGTASYTLPAGVVDVHWANLRRDGYDQPMYPISREEYEDIPDKTNQGRPDRYFVDRSAVGTGQRTVYLWPVPENSTDVIQYVALQRPLDTTAITQTAPVTYEWLEALNAGLAAKLALKYAVDRLQLLRDDAVRAWKLAREADRDKAPTTFRVSYGGRGRGR